MNLTTPSEQANKLVDQAAQSAREALLGSQRLAQSALDGASRQLDHAGEQAGALAHRATEALRRSSQQVRNRAHQAGDSTLGYIREEPVKALLIAAAAGAGLTLLLRWMAHSRD